MKVKVYNLEGKETGEMNLSDVVFGIKAKPELLHRVFVAQSNNQREPWADTKNRGEVSGGGKKPWPQKGTGRARHGSIRSPIWKGGGVAFGPLTERNYKTKINKKTRRLAIKMCLSDRAQGNAIWVVDDFNFKEPKTKFFAAFIKSLPAKDKKFLVLTPGKDANVLRMSKNIKAILTRRAEDVNVIDILSTPAIITSKAGIQKIENIFAK